MGIEDIGGGDPSAFRNSRRMDPRDDAGSSLALAIDLASKTCSGLIAACQ